jgi:ketosteroid isomerase-like protein
MPLGRACLGTFLALATSDCASPPSSGNATPPGLRAEIERATEALAAAGRANDMAAVAGFYADDALMLGPDGYRAQGRGAIDSYWQSLRGAVSDWRLETFSVAGAGDLAQGLGRSRLSLARPDEAPRISTVDFCLIWCKQPGGWKIAVDAYWPAQHGQ